MGAQARGFRVVGSAVLVLCSVTSVAQETQTFTG